MGIDSQKISEHFRTVLHGDHEFGTAFNVAQRNSAGRSIWLIGSYLYKHLANQHEGSKVIAKDFDFIIETITAHISVPEGWSEGRNRFGNLKLKGAGMEVDLVPLTNIYGLVVQKLEPRIENFLTVVPFNVQSIAYDVFEGTVIGEAGIRSLEEGVVRVHNPAMARYLAELYGTPVNEMLAHKARGLGFRAEFI